MLVVRTADGVIEWMDVADYLKRKSTGKKQAVRQVEFRGEPFTAKALVMMRNRLFPEGGSFEGRQGL
jgi:hypothetical protein